MNSISVTFADSSKHFSGVKLTNTACTYAGKIIYKNVASDANDEIGVFIKNDSQKLILIGSCVIGSVMPEHYYINLYGDDSTTEELDGANDGSELIFVAWLNSEKKEFEIPVSQMTFEKYEFLTKPDLPPMWKDKVSFGLLNLSIEKNSDTKPEINFVKNTFQVLEDETSLSLEIISDQPAQVDLTIKISVQGTAEGNGIDYQFDNKHCIIKKGQNKSSLNIRIINDVIKENNETILLTIEPTESSNAGNLSTCIIQIIDNDTLQGQIIVGPEETYKTIQAAVDEVTERGLIIVKVGTYEENIEIRKPLTIRSEGGNEKTIIKAKTYRKSVFNIYTSFVTIEGFHIYGSTSYGKAAIFLSKDSQNCYLNNNQCGFDENHYNYYGVFIEKSIGHTITNNLCNNNKRYGMLLYQSNYNCIQNNVFSQNKDSGIYISQSSNNQIIQNFIEYNIKYGIVLKSGSNQNEIYANTINMNQKNIIYYRLNNTWQSPIVMRYRYENSYYAGFIGNYYSDHSHTDSNNNGISDNSYEIYSDTQDQYPLMKPFDQYSLVLWRLESDCSMNGNKDLLKPSGLNKISPQSSLLWFEKDTDAEKKISSMDAWTGQINFQSPPEKNDQFLIEIGALINKDTFISENSNTIITADGVQTVFPLKIKGSEFSISPDKPLTLKLTNSNSKEYTIRTGGTWSYISQHSNCPDIKIIQVGQNKAYRTIGSALDASSSGYTIVVEPGLYQENLDIEKPINILSENGYTSTIISAESSRDHVFHILSNNVKIQGFSIYGATSSNKSAIYIENGMKNCSILRNRCGYDTEHYNNMGIAIGSSINNSIVENICDYNTNTGIFIRSNFENDISNNVCRKNNYYGIYVYSSMNVTVDGNLCLDNSRQGIYLKDSFCTVLSNNVMKQNYDGLYIDSSGKNLIFHNTCDYNSRYGVKVNYSSTKNTFFVNQMSNNEKANIYSQSNECQWYADKNIQYRFHDQNFLGSLGNYYGDHQSVDIDSNGICENVYIIPRSKSQDLFPLSEPIDAFKIQSHDIDYVLKYYNKAIHNDNSTILLAKEAKQSEFKLLDQFVAPNFLNPKTIKQENNNSQIKPTIQLRSIPPMGNRLKTLKGSVINSDPEHSYVAVYIHNNRWQLRPDDNNPMTTINDDGTWECDITKQYKDYLSSKIAVFVFYDTIKPPIEIHENNIVDDTRFQQAIAYNLIERTPSIILTYVPEHGNRIQNLEGFAYVEDPNQYYVAVYIYQNGWRSKPDTKHSKIKINPDAHWTCDITTEYNDHQSTKISIFILRQSFILPVISDNNQLPVCLINNAVAEKTISVK